MNRASLVRVLAMHSLTPVIAMVLVTVLAAMGKIPGSDALFVIIAAAGFGSTTSAGVTGTALSSLSKVADAAGQADTVTQMSGRQSG